MLLIGSLAPLILPAHELKREVAYVIRRYKPGKARSERQVVVRPLSGTPAMVLRIRKPYVGSIRVLGLVYEDRSRRQRQIQREVLSFSGYPNGSLLAYALVPSIRMLRKLHLFMNELRVSTWKTGKTIAVERGDVVVTRVSLRPL